MGTSVTDLDAVLVDLMVTPPAGFVAERNRLAKELRAGGDGDAAAAVGKLRRPALSDWALNMAAREEPDAVADLVDAAAELTAAQEAAMAGNDAGALKAALPRMREQTGRVATLAAGIAAREGQTGSGSSPADIGVRLGVLAGGTAAMALLRRGLLGVEDPGLVDPFAGAGPPSAPSKAAKSTATASKSSTRKQDGAKRQAASPAADDTDKAADEQAERKAAAAAARERAAAETALAAAERSVTKREAAVAEARVVVLEAQERLAALNADLEEAVAELSSAEQRRDEAGRRLAALEP